MTQLCLIAAVARNGVIGRAGGLVWHEPLDRRRFRRVTAGCPVVMGRRTWDSLPTRFRPLPGRPNVVVTRTRGWHADGATVVSGLREALAALAASPRVFVIGGAQLYASALPLAHQLVLTEIDADLEGDTHFPPWDRAQFVERSRQAHQGGDGTRFAFVTYRRIGAAQLGRPGRSPDG
jgi:dihydrofolate reductase